MQEVGFFDEQRLRSAKGTGSLARFKTMRQGDIARRPEPFWEEALARVVEGEIVPRLLLAHCAPRPFEPAKTNVAPSDLSDFLGLLFAPDMSNALTYIDDLRRRGLPPEAALLDLLAPAARLLGDLWASDRLDFVSVTLGLGRLRNIMNAVDFERGSAPSHLRVARTGLFLPAPGESHSFGVAMVETFFRAAGWRLPLASSCADLTVLEAEYLDVVGFSLSCEHNLEKLRTSIRQVRRTSKNRSILVIVGGRLFNENPDEARAVGADGTAFDAASAVSTAQSLLDPALFV
jgi:methanogenic corrinoid protein MtbC1